ncbi:hypothetical protein KQ247_14515 [Ruegeria pomeroyi]|jgi:hypothetical protein|uniref:Lipoprotein, putative n=2 Tax=Ruegeria pomeroyi TaxID=89184 RepID=Q5LUA1_RUEPO|nr:hypothetical protein [Ruegeria pomeroyi]AAV94453.1 lipoprotein, putative [Ruegeria pomeroyi DSS-3]NVK99455.1 hypothetical protein [Ruegeria pomeroyi]NVK99716.1 hypothetical protein [Ruegeria pomeroyi]QWV08034.1 hypothetical protein KQ247_14515 [Ruegeria pomeroyi]
MTTFRALLAILAVLLITACTDTQSVSQKDVNALAQQLRALGPDVDPAEAQRAAEISYSYGRQLARDYNVTSSPIVHNAKVLNGFRERGLCVHYAQDMQKRLNQENFRTLVVHRAIAEPDSIWRIDHSTAILSRRGDDMFDGVVLDPWRYGGELFWSLTREDTRYNWRPQREVLEKKAAEKLARQPS